MRRWKCVRRKAPREKREAVDGKQRLEKQKAQTQKTVAGRTACRDNSKGN